ncbi:MAG TPA: glycoside hydrolase family 75 protein [Bacteroidia bacterium]|nr:glycoside hydrolase family 75 protein [Bacteroidia bacterium]
MNDKDEFFDVPKSGTGKRTARKRGGRGFFTHLLWMAMLGAVALSALLIVVKASGKGPALRRTLIAWLGGGQEPVAKPAEDPPAIPRPATVTVEKVVEVPVEKIVEKIVEVKPPMPSGYVSWKKVDVAKLWSDIPVKTEMVTTQGDTAAKERVRDASYEIEMKVKLTVPKPNTSAAELAAINEHLPKMLKDFGPLVSAGEVSPFYHHLYNLKTERIQQNVTRIDQLVSRHNLYDLETMLQIKHPGTGRKLLLAQGEMDTVSDGSDGDRWPELDDYISMSQHYRPFTSYGWPKQTSVPNPLLGRWEAKLAEYEKEFALPGLSIDRNRFLRAQIDQYKLEVADLKSRSYLIAEAEPFVVIPLSMLGRREENEFGPAIGDYVVVVYGDKLYPAIAGDAGPTWKFGEASLRMATEINAKASAYNRPVSDLTVTYLIFPGSADEKKSPPDLEAWHQKCASLLDEIGGIGEGYTLHHWEDLVAKKKAESEAAKAPAEPAANPPTEPAEKAPAEPGAVPPPAEAAPKAAPESTDGAEAKAEKAPEN